MEWQAPLNWIFPGDGSNGLLDLYDNGYPYAAEALLEGQPGAVRKTPTADDFFLVLEFAGRIPSGAGWSAWRSAAHVQEAAMAKAPVVVRAMSDSELDAAVSRCEVLRSVWPTSASFAAMMCVAELTETHGAYSRKRLGPYTWERFLEDIKTLGSPRRWTFVRIQAHYDRLQDELARTPKERVQLAPPADRVSKRFNSEVEDFLRVEVLPAELEMLEIYLRAHRFKRQEGRFPARVREFRANVAPDVLRDPWGSEYRLRSRNGDLIVYSLGPDEKDDGGKSALPGDLKSGSYGDLILGKVGTVAAVY